MASTGPELPPHLLAKRKRQAEEEEAVAAAAAAEQAQRSFNQSPARSPNGAEKRQRTVGPALGPAAPPAPLNEKPTQPAEESEDSDHSSSSSDDDGYGPSIPTGEANATSYDSDEEDVLQRNRAQQPQASEKDTTLKRDDWMMVPPSADGLARNMDPTKLRPGRFKSGKGAAASNEGLGAQWTETPEEKRKRLQNEVFGVASSAHSSSAAPTEKKNQKSVDSSQRSRRDEESAQRIKEYNAKHRGQTLYEQHAGSKKAEQEDDPSKRAFDYEKDVGVGMKIGHSQKKEMLNRAAGFGSKFAGGKYL